MDKFDPFSDEEFGQTACYTLAINDAQRKLIYKALNLLGQKAADEREEFFADETAEMIWDLVPGDGVNDLTA